MTAIIIIIKNKVCREELQSWEGALPSLNVVGNVAPQDPAAGPKVLLLLGAWPALLSGAAQGRGWELLGVVNACRALCVWGGLGQGALQPPKTRWMCPGSPQQTQTAPQCLPELLSGTTASRHSSGLQRRGVSQPGPSAASVLAKIADRLFVSRRMEQTTPAALRLLACSRGVEAPSNLAPAKIGSGARLTPGKRLEKEKLFGARLSCSPAIPWNGAGWPS